MLLLREANDKMKRTDGSERRAALFPDRSGVYLVECSSVLLVIQVRVRTCLRLCQGIGFCGPAAIFASSLFMPFHSRVTLEH